VRLPIIIKPPSPAEGIRAFCAVALSFAGDLTVDL
jgi:hypothetical protein